MGSSTQSYLMLTDTFPKCESLYGSCLSVWLVLPFYLLLLVLGVMELAHSSLGVSEIHF